MSALRLLKLSLLTLFLISSPLQAKTVSYNFDIDYIEMNVTGSSIKAMGIGGQIPGPTIEAHLGDTLRVTFNNKMDVETSIHWHGILLPNDQDGVPYLTTPPIKPRTSFTYEYPVVHSGTYWYHSHTNLQEQQGVYGSIIFHPTRKSHHKPAREHVVVFSDWNDEKPEQTLANLKKDGDYYALKKKSVQSWDKVIQYGKTALKNRLRGSWIRMGTMDLSDVGYDAFLANGEEVHELNADAGDTVKLRLINASASTYFDIEFSAGPMTIIAADGVDIKPIKVKRLRMAIAETYDVIVHIPESRSYELRATSIDGTGKSSTFIGAGPQVLAEDTPKPNLFLAQHDHSGHKMNGSMENMGHNPSHKHGHHDGPAMPIIEHLTDYEPLKALEETTLPSDAPTREVILNLTGNMERYIWSFNNKTLSEADKVLIRKGENVRFVLKNETMMNHPIHLHGHFFRVVTKQGDYSPLKHTVNVPAMGTVIIEFSATEDKDWLFHCHNLYHMGSGMTRIIAYEESSTANQDTLKKIAHDSKVYFSNDISILSNMAAGMLRAANTRNAAEVEFDYDYKKRYDIELIYSRNITRFLDIYAGFNFEREDEHESSENTSIFGIHYTLPLLIESNFRINSNGKIRLELSSDLQLTERLKLEWSANTDKDYQVGLSYELNKAVLISTVYDSDFHWGAGARIKF